MNYSVSGIKGESIQAVMDLLAQQPHITRGELAEQCQLSLTTVGKIINGLHEYGVLSIQHSRTSEKGRAPATFTFSDSAALAMFRIRNDRMIMELTDFRLRSLHRVRHNTTPDRDPGESLMAFLLECRNTLAMTHRRIMLCGLVIESEDVDIAMVEKGISEHLSLTVAIKEFLCDVMLHAATDQKIASDEHCIAVLTDSGDGFIIYHGELCKGACPGVLSKRESRNDCITRITETFLTLSTVLSPDVLLICTEQPPERLRECIENVLRPSSLPRPIRIEARNTDDFIARGMGIAMRRAWLDEVMRDIHRLRPPAAEARTLFQI